jgi:hypothetical protein
MITSLQVRHCAEQETGRTGAFRAARARRPPNTRGPRAGSSSSRWAKGVGTSDQPGRCSSRVRDAVQRTLRTVHNGRSVPPADRPLSGRRHEQAGAAGVDDLPPEPFELHLPQRHLPASQPRVRRFSGLIDPYSARAVATHAGGCTAPPGRCPNWPCAFVAASSDVLPTTSSLG